MTIARRYLSLWTPHLAVERLTRRMGSAGPAEAPLVAVLTVKGARRLAGLDARAAALGLAAGMGLADARAMYPDLRVVESDPAAEAAALLALVDWCRRWTPLAAPDPPDGAMLDVAGAAHLFGGEAALVEDVLARLARHGVTARAAIGPTPEAAFALARFSGHRIAPPEPAAFVRLCDGLPLAALRLEPGTPRALAQAGLRRIGDVRLRPRAALAARFGPGLFTALDGLFGVAKHPISPRFEAPALLVERRFAEGVARQEDIEATLAGLVAELARQLERRGEGARRLEASFFRVDGVVRRLGAGASRPLRDPLVMARLFRERLAALGDAGLEAGFGFDLVRLEAVATEPFPAEALRLDGAGGPDMGLADLVDRLGARLGPRRVRRILPGESHLPERASPEAPAAAAARETPRTTFVPTLSPGLAARPQRLFSRPEPIETIAGTPDGPPLRFRWRRVLHVVAAVEGPERIAPDWRAEGAGLTRDYFRAEDLSGRRFWLFREGLYGRETARPRWFVHGLFG